MSAAVYRRRLFLCGALLVALVILAPLGVVGGAELACRGNPGGGCGDVGLVFILFIALPVFIAVLLYIIWTAVRRLVWLKLSPWYMVFACLIIIGNIRVAFLAPEFFSPNGSPWAAATTLFLSVFMVVSLLWIPEFADRVHVARFLPGIPS